MNAAARAYEKAVESAQECVSLMDVLGLAAGLFLCLCVAGMR